MFCLLHFLKCHVHGLAPKTSLLQVGLIEESFLETPTSILAVVFLCLQAMCIIFQFIVNSLKRFLRSKNRLGMITALDHSVWELTLVGFISLCLIALQSQITSICGTSHLPKPSKIINFNFKISLPRHLFKNNLLHPSLPYIFS